MSRAIVIASLNKNVTTVFDIKPGVYVFDEIPEEKRTELSLDVIPSTSSQLIIPNKSVIITLCLSYTFNLLSPDIEIILTDEDSVEIFKSSHGLSAYPGKVNQFIYRIHADIPNPNIFGIKIKKRDNQNNIITIHRDSKISVSAL